MIRLLFICLIILSVSQLSLYSQNRNIYVQHEIFPLVKDAAEQLKLKLKESTKLDFQISPVENYSSRGIYLGGNTKGMSTIPNDLGTMGKEGVYIKGSDKEVVIIGNSSEAVIHGIFLYLEQLGYRFYFPHPDWHIIPDNVQPFQDFEILTEPDYKSRSIWYAYGTDSKVASEDFKNWTIYNRLGGSFKVNAGHAFGGIIERNKRLFEQHPEYFAMNEKGKRVPGKQAKFCYSNKELIKLCIDDAVNQIESSKRKGDELNMVSMDPSDGWNTCHCDDCKKLGTTSDRVFYLANRVAKEVGKKYPGKWVGLYAYANHAEPTNIKLEPNVFVLVATAFNNTGLSQDDLIKEWSKRASKIGIREYYGVIAWDWDMPGRPRGANIINLIRSIPKYHGMGAISMSSETNIGWISRGVGHYVATKLLWDVHVNVSEIEDDFYSNAFPKSKDYIKKLYKDWEKNGNTIPTKHDIARWLAIIEDADQKANQIDEKKRINQIRYYLHFVALFNKWKTGPEGKEKLTNYSSLLSYVWRIRDLGVCSSYPLMRQIANAAAPSYEYKYSNKNCIWKKNTKPVTAEEFKVLWQQDLNEFKPIKDITFKNYSNKYKAVNNLSLKPINSTNNKYRGVHRIVIEIPKEKSFDFEIAAGFIGSKPQYAEVRILNNEEVSDSPIKIQKIIPDRKFHQIDFSNLKAGIYILIINDERGGCKIKSQNINYSFLADQRNKIWSIARNNFYFYVPLATKKIVIERSGPLTLKKPNGQVLSFEKDGGSSLEIEIKKGEEGHWQLLNHMGKFYLLGIPPYIGTSHANMLVPEEVK